MLAIVLICGCHSERSEESQTAEHRHHRTSPPAMRKHVLSTPPLSQGEIRAASRIDRLEGSFVAEMAVSHLCKTR
jgi:hypothetical protein